MNKKYLKSLTLFLIYCILWLIFSTVLYILIPKGTQLTQYLNINSIGIEMGLIFIIIIPVSSLVGYLFGGYVLSPVFLYFHVKLFKKRVDYGIQINKFEGFKYGIEGIFSSLMAINFTLLLLNIPNLAQIIVGNSWDDATGFIRAFPVILVFTLFFTAILFSPTWYLMDSGILYSNEKNLEETNKPIEVRSIGRWYGQFLKGYSGVSVVITYFDFVRIFLFEHSVFEPILFIVLLIIFIPFPLLLVIPTIPTLIIADKMKEHRVNYVNKIARRLDIISQVEVTFKTLE